ncbi:hypothetical protein Snoj_11050 [Streptomyces nojiriensis]|uniref:Transposase n=1 Tax=Streptomyces nojiriensis TaxID=66374 RepID=A0ABQ3SGU6_9ACTN|nr:hypothetical protein GCM10010205_40870 [Streptomyces nojiriensis]GHI67187.1 hypothetical protein Snoj_11050 [Streptomyces nojiriensis]
MAGQYRRVEGPDPARSDQADAHALNLTLSAEPVNPPAHVNLPARAPMTLHGRLWRILNGWTGMEPE